MANSTQKEFHGWVCHSKTSPLTSTTFQPKLFDPTDIEIKVTHCGICGSDIHTLRSGWGPTDYPCVVGHEIVGHITRVGSGVSSLTSPSRHLKVGDRVGIGAQSDSCRHPHCPECAFGLENHCQKQTGTYGGRFRDGSKSYGGYASRWRGPAWFAFKIPDNLPSAAAAPLLCAGITVYSPLVKNGAGPGKSVGVIGIGGLGHLGLLFARALDCDQITAISRTSAKKDEALGGLGADKFIATDEDKGWAKTHAQSLDLIISTVSSSDIPIGNYLRLLKVNGQFIQVGAPEEPFPAFKVFPLINKGVKIGGSAIGSPEEIRQMLQLAAGKKVLPWVQERPMEDVNNALADMHAGKARYRYVLVNKPETDAKL
ncbi:mannitol dehydrogenase [Paracoccidioides lutzii Pb01]|uniref:alcohol dehydrogenase (NADP(+)) n=1 Tax=Paracoccidioides lutzii (strain ATCC MYA-826 / Pb01) TaxID=502779 RepID=C1H7X2_PARBA|nr:mannitol dehydrogenase [Paracoccidioides lutzii Pb01]EEH36445.1 mannitol dehydrogenase [Paracoccidioides lutzii Pb01]